jgi:hypothetical protein
MSREFNRKGAALAARRVTVRTNTSDMPAEMAAA